MWGIVCHHAAACNRRSSALRGRVAVFEHLEHRALLSAAPVVGAIRWDAWFADNPYQQTLAPFQYQDRLPFYSTGYGTNSVTVVGDSQAVMDQEIQFAHSSGLSYWAFDWYYPTGFAGADNYNYGIYKYLSSAYKSQINFCLLLQGDWLGPKANWNATVNTLVGMMTQPTYQKVLGNRPLVYIYSVDALATTFGSDAGAKAAMNTLRQKAVAAGLGSPYIVAQVWDPAAGVNAITKDGLDAIGAYVITPWENGAVAEFPHSDLAAANTLFWNQTTATGKDVVPIVSTGWDNRPRWPDGVNGEEPGPWFTAATPTDIQNDVTAALNWTHTNAPADKANAVLMYAWNENDEGGWLVPTIAAGSARLDAVQQALAQFQPQPKAIAIAGQSFEAPKVSTWYVVPATGPDASLGWYTGAGPGTSLLATPAAGHFTRAADGQQALLLSAAGAAWQDIGASQANTSYTVSFSLLTGKPGSDKQGTVTVKLFDGANLITTKNFTAPKQRDTWQSFSVAGNIGATPAGDLTIEFVSTSGAPWLDNVAIKSQAVATSAAKTATTAKRTTLPRRATGATATIASLARVSSALTTATAPTITTARTAAAPTLSAAVVDYLMRTSSSRAATL